MRALVRFGFTNAVAALLVGCGGSQPPIGAPSAMSQSHTSAGYTILHSFGKRYSGGQEPKAALIDVNGILYGTTFAGGSTPCVGGCGVVFSIAPSGKETTLYRFQGGNDGANPSASLLDVKGLLYGTAENYGGGYAQGTVFSVTTSGILKTLYAFQAQYKDGAKPVSSLIYLKGELYGTTYEGGDASCFGDGCGTVYSVTVNGTEKVLHNFTLFDDGAYPAANLTDVGGTLYGTTEYGEGTSSSSGVGTVFSVSTAGTERVLYDSPGGSGATIFLAGLISVNNVLYGTSAYGGAMGPGTVFSITTSGSLTILHSFGSGYDGSHPYAPLLNVHGKLYGTTKDGGAYGKGTIFKMSLDGSKEKVLHSFGYGSDGAMPLAGLIDVDGTLYGTTSAGGLYGNGTVFALKLQPHEVRGQ